MKRTKIKLHSVAAALLLMATFAARAEFSGNGSLNAYAPQLAVGDKPIAMELCSQSQANIDGVQATTFKCKTAVIDTAAAVRNSRTGPLVIKLSLQGNTAAKKSFRLAGKIQEFGLLKSVHELDLNDDGKPDFVLEMGEGSQELLFLMSNSKGYDWQMLPQQRAPSVGQLYKDAEGRKVLLTTRLSSDAARFGIARGSGSNSAFLVYDTVRFSKDTNQFVYAPTDNFPVWVSYDPSAKGAAGSLHKPTTLITREAIRKNTRAPLDKQRGGRMQELG
jgi:hypothetical protein